MNEAKSNARTGRDSQAERKPGAGEAQRTPDTDMQTEDAGTAASGTANQGSPAAPVMKQFAKTKTESSGRP